MNALVEWLSKLLQGVKLWVTVKPWERCVRVRLGKWAVVLDPGVHFRIPLADDVMLFNSRLRIASFSAQTLMTLDRKVVSIAGNIGFRIDDPLRAMKSLHQPEYSCAALVQRSVAAYVTARECADLNAEALQLLAKEDLQRIAGGLTIEHVSVTDFAPVNRTFRLFGNEWRPETRPDAHDKYTAD
jgi:modulator of FtsH protease HflK